MKIGEKNLLLSLLVIWSVTGYCQNYTLPSVLFDSLTFEVVQGRECSKLADSYLNQIYYRDSLLEEGAKLIELQAGVIESQNAIINDWPKEVRANAQIYEAEKKRLKNKIRKARRLAFFEGGLLILIAAIAIQ